MESGTEVLNYPSALAFLYGRIDYERNAVIPYCSRTFKLDRMRELLTRLGNPHHAVKVVHVAGTKGKGSTCAMISAALSAAGHNVGLYTSPHLERLEERFRIAGRPCSPAELVELTAQIQSVVLAMDREATASTAAEAGPTYFEVTTAMALLYFCQRAVDLAVVEVGLGGRLDSTNVCLPLVSVITSISFDHTMQLGHTLRRIATEKAGIIKPGIPVVSGVRAAKPRKAIREAARKWGCRTLELGGDFDVIRNADPGSGPHNAMGFTNRMDYRQPPDVSLNDVDVNLAGCHQLENAAVAIATLHELRRSGWDVDERSIRAGLAHVRWPARAEIFPCRPIFVLDTAHNVASMTALNDVLQQIPVTGRRWLLFAASRDKDVRGMLTCVLPSFDEFVFTRFENNLRSAAPDLLAAKTRKLIAARGTGSPFPNLVIVPNAHAAWLRVIEMADEDDLICVTGSFFIAAEFRNYILDFTRQATQISP